MDAIRNSLSAHLKTKIDTRQAVLDRISTQKPKFPDPKTKIQKKKTEEQKSEKSDAPVAASEAVSSSALLDGIKDFNKKSLKPTTTVVRHIGDGPTVVAATNSNYISIGANEDLEAYWDDEKDLQAKIDVLAELVKKAQNLVIHTGAGISTAAKIPDYRSKGCGVWVMNANGVRAMKQIDMDMAQPTVAHMAVSELVKRGICKLVVSTNMDGLHRKSGVPVDKLAELHGNCYKETCDSCHKEFMQDFDTVKNGQTKDHYTGRLCDVDGCSGRLKDSIVNFGEDLPARDFRMAAAIAPKTDLAIVLGSSLRVSPSCTFPSQGCAQGGKLVIVNLQKTQYDAADNGFCWLHAYGAIDHVMSSLMARLQIEIPTAPIPTATGTSTAPASKGEANKGYAFGTEPEDRDRD